ncbi:DUF3027 domain-containing protein [Arthrobacter sp. NPDC089319]|uniref:DUF3027 domain-containing protein n=1 Tax=Arthrobacter sp. NPDC089319 TaxID=3155915 RepID=UPI0034432CA5
MTENLIDSGAETAPVEQPVAGGPEAAAAPRRRAARRTAKLDLVLAAAVDRAREGVLEIAPAEQIGEHAGSYADGDRLVTHRFEAKLAGYAGWQWYSTLARVPRGKEATVCEVGLLPSEGSLLAPEWVPWADRVRPEEVAAAAEAEAAEAAEAAAATEAQDDAEEAPTPDAGEVPAAESQDETAEVGAAVDENAADEAAPASAAADASAGEGQTDAAETNATEDFTQATS